MSVTEDDFDLSLLSPAELAEDPHPDRPFVLSVLGRDSAGAVVPSIEVRTGPAQLGSMFAKYRALQLTLADRATKRARAEETVTEARQRMLREANAHLPQAEDPEAAKRLLLRLRGALENYPSPPPQDSPQSEIGP
ncbi:hypothetical protein [Streptomyces sp. Midd1]|uniref:hypothetical protein n=1 Tax=Streptomyces sp. Midd3 TaxID=3161191 RepID=UPI0034DB60C6